MLPSHAGFHPPGGWPIEPQIKAGVYSRHRSAIHLRLQSRQAPDPHGSLCHYRLPSQGGDPATAPGSEPPSHPPSTPAPADLWRAHAHDPDRDWGGGRLPVVGPPQSPAALVVALGQAARRHQPQVERQLLTSVPAPSSAGSRGRSDPSSAASTAAPNPAPCSSTTSSSRPRTGT